MNAAVKRDLSQNVDETGAAPGTGMLERAFAVIRALSEAQPDGARVTRLAKAVGLTQGTVHRILQALIAEGIVEQDEGSKLYRLSVNFFALAAQAGNPSGMRTLCRPALLRLCASLGDTIFLLVKSSFDAVCLDICEGPFPIRSFTGDIGGRVALGVGQGSLAILAFLPEAEREEIIRFNVPRIRGYGVLDEVYLRTEIERVRQLGYAGRNSGVLDGMAGVAVPILDRTGVAVAALSVGTLAARLSDDRLPMVVELLRRQAEAIGPQTNPFDVALRRPMHGLSRAMTSVRIAGSEQE
ncbi:IclR family transcriptional regulator [Paraburkholderia sp. SIMBA_055]|jgi:DNA-binding IclR family transcriptional regulator|uniref:Transcriptional regulator, IclR family n=1 Tax=Paraburkholderia graminis (strain ATCC 700544 / DSM 17151 / LMG 18924 / NCIMB 13744 / C4D1M) TaxID=396598 RepID=B1G0Q3_PARG4|nr:MULTISPECIES: IclR family transcriptional regulator [Paraburkholderia]AXF11621.1 IclR family transcriptional regulator [Paraburkholderia graminis]EDT10134.1 transcriptional regulator, IclR family [Paraburkholderia graminis C4D1M]MDR6471356.1 DNA-binding IclR family transcriptional regulator [Paraburkholderia graminis]MDR6477496.1 DNA-binding IclR family transcriptional regulator [Paraburkholderia graminis]PTR02951.1 IclR family transcriptional regulator [Paraburkholderia sp. GV072]